MIQAHKVQWKHTQLPACGNGFERIVMLSIVVIFALSAIGVVADVFIKIAGQSPMPASLKWFLLGSGVYMVTVPGWFLVMKQLSLSSLGAIYAVSTILLLVIVDVLWFRGRLSAVEVIGVACAIVSVVILRRVI
jgi:multidrug transporter EmrE-like cation transporter